MWRFPLRIHVSSTEWKLRTHLSSVFWCYRKFSHWKWLNYESQTLNTLDETHPAIVMPNLKSTKKSLNTNDLHTKLFSLWNRALFWFGLVRFGFNIARDTLKSNYTDTPCFYLHSKVVCCGFCLEKQYFGLHCGLTNPHQKIKKNKHNN